MTVDFKPFAIDGGANVIDQAAYEALAALADGFSAGIAPSAQLNKVWRQASFISAGLAELVSTLTGEDVLDDGDLPGFIEKLAAALQQSEGAPLVLTAAGPYTISGTTRNYIVKQAVPAAFTINLPASPSDGFLASILDGLGDAATNNITVNGNGHNINGAATFVMNFGYQAATFLWNGTQFNIK